MNQSNLIPIGGSHFISLETAETLTSYYRSMRETILASGYKNKNVLPLSETFSVADIKDLIEQPGCTGFRIYYGMKEEDDTVHAVMVAVNEDNEDIIFSESSKLSGENIIIEEGQRCPVICPPSSPLNS